MQMLSVSQKHFLRSESRLAILEKLLEPEAVARQPKASDLAGGEHVHWHVAALAEGWIELFQNQEDFAVIGGPCTRRDVLPKRSNVATWDSFAWLFRFKAQRKPRLWRLGKMPEQGGRGDGDLALGIAIVGIDAGDAERPVATRRRQVDAVADGKSPASR
jgi:hypothetical protein